MQGRIVGGGQGAFQVIWHFWMSGSKDQAGGAPLPPPTLPCRTPRPPAGWASLASAPPEDVSLEGRLHLLISMGSLSLKPSAGPRLAPSLEREALALSANRLLSPSRALFYFHIILFPANILAFPKTPGFIIVLAFPGSWEVEHKAAIIACSIQPPSPRHTRLAAAAGSRPATPSRRHRPLWELWGRLLG